MSGTTIAIEDQGTLRKITKIVPYSSGGFAVLAPYHSARQGHLLKPTVDYSKRDMEIAFEDAIQYSAEDRVKLSLHPDGFVQFSGENPGKIVSGRDPETGEPNEGPWGSVPPFEQTYQHRPDLRMRGMGCL